MSSSKIAEKIERKMAAIEHLMLTQMHITLPEAVLESLDNISIYWGHMGDADKDYVQCARIALEEKLEWKV